MLLVFTVFVQKELIYKFGGYVYSYMITSVLLKKKYEKKSPASIFLCFFFVFFCDWLKSEIQSGRHRSSYAIVRRKPLLLWESMSCGVGTKIVISDCICDSWLMRRVNNQLRKRLHMTSYTKQGENGGGWILHFISQIYLSILFPPTPGFTHVILNVYIILPPSFYRQTRVLEP